MSHLLLPTRNHPHSAKLSCEGSDFSSAEFRVPGLQTPERTHRARSRRPPRARAYLGGRVHGRAPAQELLHQPHVALLGRQVQRVESILQEKKQGLRVESGVGMGRP